MSTLPSNVTLRHWDVKEDAPEDLVGAFDIVHVRFLATVLKIDKVPVLAEKLFKILIACFPDYTAAQR